MVRRPGGHPGPSPVCWRDSHAGETWFGARGGPPGPYARAPRADRAIYRVKRSLPGTRL